MNYVAAAVFWNERDGETLPGNRTTTILLHGPIRVGFSVNRRAHGYARAIGEAIMYGRDNAGIGVRIAP